MRKAFLIISIAGISFLCLAAQRTALTVCAQEEETASGERVWDFGKIPSNTKVEHVFTFRNDGKDKLTIKNVTTSCGCTASDIDKKELAPGEETGIKVSFNSSAYRGQIKQFVYVATDNLAEPLVKFTIVADVQPAGQSGNVPE